MNVLSLREKVLNGYHITKEEAVTLAEKPLGELTSAANDIRKYFCGNGFDICTIINAKSGKCSENCKFCSQSSFYKTPSEQYAVCDTQTILEQAKYNSDKGVLRYSLVTSGKRLNSDELALMSENVKAIRKNTDLNVCVSFGLLDYEQYLLLKSTGVTRIHNNLETSQRYFPQICTTHTFEDKIKSIKAAQEVGLKVCSGGIMGLGESMEDRIDLALTLRELGTLSVPVNMLNPIPGTPFENNEILTNEDMCKIVAIYRFILPKAFIRLAGGRGLLTDKGKKCFMSGANAAISGDMLTTAGITIDTDMEMLKELGYEVTLQND